MLRRSFQVSFLSIITIFSLLVGGHFVFPFDNDSAPPTPPSYSQDAAFPSLSAKGWYVYDIDTSVEIMGKNESATLPIASVTKLMTALIAFTQFDMQASTTVSERSVSEEGRSGRLVAGEQMSLHELLFPLLLESSNDAADAFAEFKSRDEMLAAMNARADELGMTHTHYDDPSGLSPKNVSSAGDLALLLTEIYKNHRHLLDITMLPQYVGTNHDWLNNDPAAAKEGFLGGKHGYTEEASRTFAGVYSQTMHDGTSHHIGIILLGSENLSDDIDALRSHISSHISFSGGP